MTMTTQHGETTVMNVIGNMKSKVAKVTKMRMQMRMKIMVTTTITATIC